MVVLFDRFNLPEDVYEIIFATNQQKVVAKMLVEELKLHADELTKTEMSIFANKLHEGFVTEIDEPAYRGKKVRISYNKRQFYDRILTPMKGMGLIDYDIYKKTYRVSDKFNKAMTTIGFMWLQELRKKQHFIAKK
ncbi:hypothetical protein HYY72_03145 [Candidatus Woesearchaeota archaeon]|nr:hypothetical protein [Candidatus Woesearchaeota archaeon]